MLTGIYRYDVIILNATSRQLLLRNILADFAVQQYNLYLIMVERTESTVLRMWFDWTDKLCSQFQDQVGCNCRAERLT